MGLFNLKPPQKVSRTVLLGKYELGRKLGSGSFAKVHVARSIESGELVAVKIIDKKKTRAAHMEPRIIREIEAMRRLQNHQHILKIHEVMATKSKIYIIMELATGGELFTKLLRSGRPSESEARRYFQQLLSALSFCHREGIVHRDVKPQNLLLDKEGNLKVCDFGLSALPEHRTSAGLLLTYCGTPSYAAPEVIAMKAYDGVKADAWSCGVVLFVILAGYLPFDDSNVFTMSRQMNRREFRFSSRISRPVRGIIYKLLDPNPTTRMSIETVMGTSWFKKKLKTPDLSSSLFELDRFLVKEEGPRNTITAFDLLTMSSGWDLSKMFGGRKRNVKRFTVKVSTKEVVEKVQIIGEKLGFRVEKKEQVRVVGLGKGRTVVVVEAVELVEGLVLAEVKVVEGEEKEEEAHWLELIGELEKIVLSWQNEDI